LEYNETVHQIFIDLKKDYDSVRREVLYCIPIQFGIPMKLVLLIKMCVSETFVCSFPIQNGFNREMHYHHCFSTSLWTMPLGRFRKVRWD
jgi:hypothetical protein